MANAEAPSPCKKFMDMSSSLRRPYNGNASASAAAPCEFKNHMMMLLHAQL